MFIRQKQSKKGFTLIELLVVIAIIAILATILMPSLATARNLARKIACMSNLKGIGTSLHMYATENQNLLPPAVGAYYYFTYPWITGNYPFMFSILYENEYLDDPRIAFCPLGHEGMFDYESQWPLLSTGNVRSSYMYRHVRMFRSTGLQYSTNDAAGKAIYADLFTWPAYTAHADSPKGYNVLYADGYVNFIDFDETIELNQQSVANSSIQANWEYFDSNP